MGDGDDDVIPIRYNERPKVYDKVFDLSPEHPLVNQYCPACDEQFGPDLIVLVPVGPGPDTAAIEASREGRWHSAVTVPVHLTCTGYTREEIE